MERKNKLTIDMVYYLQNYAEGWTNGEFIEKMDVQDCLESPPYDKNDENNMYNGHFFHFHKDIQAKINLLEIKNKTYHLDMKSVVFDQHVLVSSSGTSSRIFLQVFGSK